MMQTPESDRLDAPHLAMAGFRLWIHGRLCPHSDDRTLGDWLNITAHVEAVGASVRVSGDLLLGRDFVSCAEECEALMRGKKDGKAGFGGVEAELDVRIEPGDRSGHYKMTVEISPDVLKQEHVFEFDIDRSELEAIAQQCRAIAQNFPSPGRILRPRETEER